eukprot:2638987-Rhodomonas_salina.2
MPSSVRHGPNGGDTQRPFTPIPFPPPPVQEPPSPIPAPSPSLPVRVVPAPGPDSPERDCRVRLRDLNLISGPPGGAFAREQRLERRLGVTGQPE